MTITETWVPVAPPSRLAILGATGGTGRLLTEQALARGYAVSALVRDPARLPAHCRDRVRVHVGDALEASAVHEAVAGADAVLVALGVMPEGRENRDRLAPRSPACSEGTRHALAAMAAHGVPRLVVETAVAVGSSRQNGAAGAGLVIGWILRHPMADKERQEAFVRASGLDWTIVRPVRLTDGAPGGRVQTGESLRWGWRSQVSRADVAAWMLDALMDATTVRRCLTLSGS